MPHQSAFEPPHSNPNPNPATLIKYPGGKAEMAPTILDKLGPVDRWTSYAEPFAGGLSVLFAARAAGYAGPAFIGESNPWIREMWRTVRDEPGAVAMALLRMQEAYRKVAEVSPGKAGQPARVAFYLGNREILNTWTGAGAGAGNRACGMLAASAPVAMFPDTAARLIWALRTGFNGLVRNNRRGKLNVPAGSAVQEGKPIYLPSAAAILAAGRALHGVEIFGGYEAAMVAAVNARGLNQMRVYCDPPYVGTFGYSSTWAREDRVRLGEYACALATGFGTWRCAGDPAARVVLSEADTPEARADFSALDADPMVIPVRRSISRKGSGRVKVDEGLWCGGEV